MTRDTCPTPPLAGVVTILQRCRELLGGLRPRATGRQDDEADFFPQSFALDDEHDSALETGAVGPEDGAEWVDATKDLIAGLWTGFFAELERIDQPDVAAWRREFLAEAEDLIDRAETERGPAADDRLHFDMLMALHKFSLLFIRRLARRHVALEDNQRRLVAENWRLELDRARLLDEKAHLRHQLHDAEAALAASRAELAVFDAAKQSTGPEVSWPSTPAFVPAGPLA